LGFLGAFPRCAGLSAFKMKKLSFEIVICWLITLLFATCCYADVDSSRSQLEQIKGRIDRAEKALKNKQKSELNISRELALLSKALKRVRKKVGLLKKEHNLLVTRISSQQHDIVASKRKVKKVGKQLKRRLVALYKEGESGALKILFSANSPTEMVQQYHYLTKVLEYDQQLLSDYRAVNLEQKQQLDKLNQLEGDKKALLVKQQQQQQVAEQGRRLQARLLKRAKKDKQKLAREVLQLKKNAARLKKLIAKLESQEPIGQTKVSTASDFAAGRGKLGWPVTGRVVIGFGKQKDKKLGTYYESNGLEISVPPGSPIRAVASGTIVFADYFKGYGNLFIVSHPGGYHTLYAQTDKMLKDLNDTVKAGDVIGYSGLGGRDSIYFEIRAQGSPVNPLRWLRKL